MIVEIKIVWFARCSDGSSDTCELEKKISIIATGVKKFKFDRFKKKFQL